MAVMASVMRMIMAVTVLIAGRMFVVVPMPMLERTLELMLMLMLMVMLMVMVMVMVMVVVVVMVVVTCHHELRKISCIAGSTD